MHIMRIDEIRFNNFRKFVDGVVEFPKSKDDLHLIIADNGVGKTTFLNAITWCLYNSEPKTKGKESEAYTVLNSKIAETAKDGEECSASVVMKVSDEHVSLVIRRESIFKINSISSDYYKEHGFREEFKDQKVSLVVKEKGGDAFPILDEDEIDRYISSFVPESINEFFFFDMEKLDDYFLTNSNIRKQTEKLSHIQVLKSMMGRIDNVIDDYDELIVKTPESEELWEEYKTINNNCSSIEKELNETTANYELLKEEYDGLVSKLKNIESVSKLQEDLEKLDEKIESNKNSLDSQKNQLNDLVIKKSPNIFVKCAFENCLDIIKEHNKDEDYIEEIYLTRSIDDKKCLLCEHDLDEGSIDLINEKIMKFYSIPPEIKFLDKNYKSLFVNLLKDNEDYLKQDENYQNVIDTLEDNISDFEKEKTDLENEIDVIIGLKEDTDRRDELKGLLDDLNTKITQKSFKLEELKKSADSKYQEYEKALSDEKDVMIVKKKKNLLKHSKDVVYKTYLKIMDETRLLIEKTTTDNFKNTIRKKESFDRITLDENYSINLYDGDRVITASASASETQILALSFALAVHSISNYISPLVIDTPLARTSGVNKSNMAKAYLDVSESRQIVLVLFDDEYTDSVKSVLPRNNFNFIRFKESEDESEIFIERD